MNFKEYKEYIKNNPEGLWFKNKWYGWGWVPAKWQGWAVIAVFIVVLLLNALYFDSRISSDGNLGTMDLVLFLGIEIVAVAILFWICYKKGEKPRWSWGDPRKK